MYNNTRLLLFFKHKYVKFKLDYSKKINITNVYYLHKYLTEIEDIYYPEFNKYYSKCQLEKLYTRTF